MRRAGEFANAWLRPEDCVALERLRPCITDRDACQYWADVSTASWCLATHSRVTGDRLRLIARTELARRGLIQSGKRMAPGDLSAWWKSAKRACFLDTKGLAPLEEPTWIQQSLMGRRNDHPLKWAALLAALMATEELKLALDTSKPEQMTLDGKWEQAHMAREDLLTSKVWGLLDAGMNILDVAAQTGIPAPKLRHALRLNPTRQRARNRKMSNQRRDTRREIVSLYLLAHPGSGRVDVSRAHSAELRWLEEHDSIWITQMLRESRTNRYRQKVLDFGAGVSPRRHE